MSKDTVLFKDCGGATGAEYEEFSSEENIRALKSTVSLRMSVLKSLTY